MRLLLVITAIVAHSGFLVSARTCYTHTRLDWAEFTSTRTAECEPGQICSTTINRVSLIRMSYAHQCTSRPDDYQQGCKLRSYNKNYMDCYCDADLCNSDSTHDFDAFINYGRKPAVTGHVYVLLGLFITGIIFCG